MVKTIRFASFNAALNRSQAGGLITDLSTPNNQQAQNVAEIIQRINPDVLALQEIDYDKGGKALQLFQDNYLRVSQNGAQPIYFKCSYAVPSNTGIPSGMDLDKDGKTDSPSDALAFGFHPGQYAFAILSKYPIQWDNIRTFQKFLWKDMLGARLPKNPATGEGWYSAAALDIFRLSSKNHVDVPIEFPTGIIHTLVAHPTPPVFDGEEKRNRRRNFDEIRLFADYITPGKGDYLYDDKGQKGGLDSAAHFIIMGDMNADPVDGESNAINQLLKHPRLHAAPTTHHTTTWGLRVDYVLPSKKLKICASGVFWPDFSEPLYYLVEKKGEIEASSDHRLVWVDLASLIK
jgi:endonuclease/exonuclease/phosphatase family metal-dependent hydrolase